MRARGGRGRPRCSRTPHHRMHGREGLGANGSRDARAAGGGGARASAGARAPTSPAEPRDAGTLRLYADDPAGVRMPLTPASPTADLTVTAAAGAPVVSAPFRMPPDAERVVAVYQGQV